MRAAWIQKQWDHHLSSRLGRLQIGGRRQHGLQNLWFHQPMLRCSLCLQEEKHCKASADTSGFSCAPKQQKHLRRSSDARRAYLWEWERTCSTKHACTALWLFSCTKRAHLLGTLGKLSLHAGCHPSPPRTAQTGFPRWHHTHSGSCL